MKSPPARVVAEAPTRKRGRVARAAATVEEIPVEDQLSIYPPRTLASALTRKRGRALSAAVEEMSDNEEVEGLDRVSPHKGKKPKEQATAESSRLDRVEILFRQVESFLERGNPSEADKETHLSMLELGLQEAIKKDMLEPILDRYVGLRRELQLISKDTSVQPGHSAAGKMAPWIKEDLPSFDGKCSEWAEFEDVFRLEVGDREGYSDAMKLRRLQSCLKGPPRRLIDRFGIHVEGAYAAAWTLLRNQYSDSLESFRECVAQIFAVAPVRRGDCEAAHTLIVNVLSGVEKAKRMDEDGLARAAAAHLLNQMDPNTREQFRSNYKGEAHPSLDEVAEFFLGKARTWEEQSKAAKPVGTELVSATSKVNNRTEFEAGKRENGDRPARRTDAFGLKCYHCQGAHRLMHCRLFDQLAPSAKIQLKMRHGLCTKCVGTHPREKCQAK